MLINFLCCLQIVENHDFLILHEQTLFHVGKRTQAIQRFQKNGYSISRGNFAIHFYQYFPHCSFRCINCGLWLSGRKVNGVFYQLLHHSVRSWYDWFWLFDPLFSDQIYV